MDTLEEQLQLAFRERSSKDLWNGWHGWPGTGLHSPLAGGQPEEEEVFIDERPTTHISVWLPAPFFVAESLDLGVNFPLTGDRLEDIVKWALRIIPETWRSWCQQSRRLMTTLQAMCYVRDGWRVWTSTAWFWTVRQ